MQFATMRFEAVTDFRNSDADILLVGEIYLDVVFRPGRPWAVFGKSLT
jgi:hypothetical protein